MILLGPIQRVVVPQTISQAGWKYLLTQVRYPFIFDSEIFGIHVSAADQLRKFDYLADTAQRKPGRTIRPPELFREQTATRQNSSPQQLKIQSPFSYYLAH
jgi:hypothetical protein